MGDADCSIGNRVSDVEINVCGARWVLEAVRGPVCKVHDFPTSLLYI